MPFSPCVHADDWLMPETSASGLCDGTTRVVVTEKMDGGNCCLRGGKVYGRTHSHEAQHWSFGAVKGLYAGWAHVLRADGLPDDMELFGENMAAVHSLSYDALCSPFYLFAARSAGRWLAWTEVARIAELLQVPTVPLVFTGSLRNLAQLRELLQGEALLPSRASTELPGEGFVVRVAGAFDDADFERCVSKYVRANHVQTGADWKTTCAKAAISRSLADARSAMRPPIEAESSVQLFVDLDGVLADFDQGVRDITGRAPDRMACSAMWRSISGARDFFGRLDWMPGAQELWEDHLAPLRPTILSGVPMSSSNWAERQKRGWCAAHLGPNVPVICCASRDKQTYSGPGRVLIDDRKRAAGMWEAQGGTFILYKDAPATARRLHSILDQMSAQENSQEESQGTSQGAFQGASQEASQEAQATCGKKSTKKKKKQKSKQARPRPCKYRFIALAGLPGSGKSTFAAALQARFDRMERVSQDETGSRKVCESLVGKLAKRNTVVLDRCNVSVEERAYWAALSMVPPAKAAVVYFAGSAEACSARVAERQGHPTIRGGSVAAASKIVSSFAKSLERPSLDERCFSRVFTVENLDTDIERVLAQL